MTTTTNRDHLEDLQTFERTDRIALRNLDPERESVEESPYLNEWNANHDEERGAVWAGATTERPRGLESALDAYRARKAKRNAPEADRYTDDDLQALAEYYIGA